MPNGRDSALSRCLTSGSMVTLSLITYEPRGDKEPRQRRPQTSRSRQINAEAIVSEALLRLYHRLPGSARSAAATAVGWSLRSWRFGADAERRVAAALDRDSWSAARWQEHQQSRLTYVLHRAATRVPYYRNQWNERRRKGDHSSWEVLANWPILREKHRPRAPPRVCSGRLRYAPDVPETYQRHHRKTNDAVVEPGYVARVVHVRMKPGPGDATASHATIDGPSSAGA